MTAPQTRVGIPGIIRDHHRRIRRLEASPGDGGGSGGGDCPDCVQCPYCVNPGDITVPDIYHDCVDVAGGIGSWGTICGTGDVMMVSGVAAGYCSYTALGQPIGVQVRINVALSGNMSNVIIYAGVLQPQAYAKTWPVAGSPGASPPVFDSGWVDLDSSGLCGGASCSAMTIGASFNSHATFSGGCTFGGYVALRYVVLDEDDEYRGALDQIPQPDDPDADGDVIYFSQETHEFTTGPARRRTSYFMG